MANNSSIYRKLYNEGEELVPDFVYDTMFSQEDAELDDVGQGELVDHLHFMGSLPTYFLDYETLKFEDLEKITSFRAHNGLYDISAKIDGVPGSCWYKYGKPVKVLSRGKREQGFVMAPEFLKVLPTIDTMCPNEMMDIRGEFYINKKDFEEINGILAEAGEKTFSNPRSMVSSCVNSIHPHPLIMSRMQVLFHGIWYESARGSHFTILDKLFPEKYVAKHNTADKDALIDAMKDMYEELFVSEYDIPVDGIVVQHTITNENDGRCNLDRVAIKQFDEAKFSAESTVTNIEWNVSSKGEYVPLIWFNEVEINGSKVQKCSGFCYDFIDRMGINIGCDVQVVMRGGVIPYINKVTNRIRGIDRNIPEDSFLREGDPIHLWCKNANAVDKEKFVRGGSLLKWDTFGEVFWNDLWEETQISNIFSLIALARSGDLKLCGTVLPDTAIGKQREATFINNLKNISFEQLIIAARIDGIGEKTAKTVAEHFETGISLKKTKYISQFLDNKDLYDKIATYGNKTTLETVKSDGRPKVIMSKKPSNGMKKMEFYTHFLQDYELTDTIGEASLLICPKGENSSKITYAQKHNIEIKYYEDFVAKSPDIDTGLDNIFDI